MFCCHLTGLAGSIFTKKTTTDIQWKPGNFNVKFSKLPGLFKTTDSPEFFTIIYSKNSTNFSNSDILKNLIFQTYSKRFASPDQRKCY